MTGRFEKERLVLFLMIALAFAVRFAGVPFGLPNLYHADEPIVVNHTMAYGIFDLNPHFFKIPPLTSYFLFLIYGLFYLLGHFAGIFPTVLDFAYLFVVDPSSFYLLGRGILGVGLGTLSVYCLYRFTKRFFSREAASLAAFFLAVAFLHVRDSHYIYADIPLVLILILCFFLIFRILNQGKLRDYAGFGILAGLAVATKYNGVFIWFPFLLAHLFGCRSAGKRFVNSRLFIALFVSIPTYAALNPFSLIDFQFFLNELISQSKAEGPTSFLHHIRYSLNGALGPFLLVFALLGILHALIRREQKNLVMSSFVVIYYLVLCFFSQPYDRYVLPLIPWLLVFAAHFLLWLKEKFRLSKPAYIALICLLAGPPLAKTLLSDFIFMQKDVRNVAQEWIERNIPAGSKIALDIPFFMPRLKPTLGQLEEKRSEMPVEGRLGASQSARLDLLIREARQSTRPRYQLFFLSKEEKEHGFLFSKPAISYDLKRLKQEGIDYLITCRITPEFQKKFYTDLMEKTEALARFSPYKDLNRKWPIDSFPLTGGPFLWRELLARKTNGQIITIYRLK